MANFSNMISVFFLIFFVSIASSNHAGPDGTLTDAINKFSTQLHSEVSQNNNKNGGHHNLFVGGMSAHIMLALLSLGATGNTLKELNNGLHLKNKEVVASYQQTIQNMNSYKNIKFHWSDKLYVQNGQIINADFQASATLIFGAEVGNIDFSKGDQAAAQINSWVGEKTQNTVKDLVNGKDINTAKAALVNTMYFQGTWDKPFDPKKTEKKEFYIDPEHLIPVDTMNQECQTNYGENAALDAKILEMAFNGNEMSMIVILPNKVDGLEGLEKKLANTNIVDVVKNLTQQTVYVSLPKFEVGSNNAFKSALCNLDMCSVFNANAELNGILPNSVLINVYHKTSLNWHEGGVTAGDATAVAVTQKNPHSKRSNSYQFKADHPYYFAGINKDNQLVFSGHFTGKAN